MKVCLFNFNVIYYFIIFNIMDGILKINSDIGTSAYPDILISEYLKFFGSKRFTYKYLFVIERITDNPKFFGYTLSAHAYRLKYSL